MAKTSTTRMKIVFILVFVLVHTGVVYNFILLSIDTVSGNASIEKLLVKPRYEIMRVPANNLTYECNAVDRLSADFAQVYFPSRTASTAAYTPETNDPWGRCSRYAPLLHKVCQYTLCRMPYGYASLLHILIQLMLLYISLYFAFKTLQLRKGFLFTLLITNIVLLLTPAGLSWFERGQFSVYVALAYLWLFLGIIKRNPYYLALSAMFAFIKWTSFPFIFIAVSLWVINALLVKQNIKEIKATVLMAGLIPLTITLLFVIDLEEGLKFLYGLLIQEQTNTPAGVSMTAIVPLRLVKTLPFLLVFLGAFLIWWKKNSEYISQAPYLCAAAILSLTFPTLALDYSTPDLLCFLPLLLYWAERSYETPIAVIKRKSNLLTMVTNSLDWLPPITLLAFSLFLLLASTGCSLADQLGLPKSGVAIVIYGLGVLYFMIVFVRQGSTKSIKETIL